MFLRDFQLRNPVSFFFIFVSLRLSCYPIHDRSVIVPLCPHCLVVHVCTDALKLLGTDELCIPIGFAGLSLPITAV